VHHKVEAVATVDDAGIIRACNDNFLPIFGFRKDELIGVAVSSRSALPWTDSRSAQDKTSTS
jgi:PAS domain S-box-containing protein